MTDKLYPCALCGQEAMQVAMTLSFCKNKECPQSKETYILALAWNYKQRMIRTEARLKEAVSVLEDKSLAPTHRAIRAREILLGIGRME